MTTLQALVVGVAIGSLVAPLMYTVALALANRPILYPRSTPA